MNLPPEFQRLHSMPKNPNLTNNAVNDVDNKFRDTNPNTTHINDVHKRSTDESESVQRTDTQNIPDSQVTVKELEHQVDELVENYNRLARSLNRPLINETIPSETNTKLVSNRFMSMLLKVIIL